MKIEDARPGAVIKERHVTAHPRTVVAWENDGFGKTLVVVKNAAGRRTKIKAKNISRYDLVKGA
jgi:hypothetical protein